jgi:hypothetical protein
MKLKMWVDLAEISASIAVVISLVVLIFQIRESNELRQYEAGIRTAEWDSRVFIESNHLSKILAKIKEVDGIDPYITDYANRYGLTLEEVGIWTRWLALTWSGMAEEYDRYGPNDDLASAIERLASYRDQELWLEGHILEGRLGPYSDEFRSYVRQVLELDN